MSTGGYQHGTPALRSLHTAVVCGDADLVRQLIQDGADVNQEEPSDSEPPLFKAAGLDDPKIAEALLAAKADVNWSGSEFSFTALHQAVCLNNFKMVEVLLAGGAAREEEDESGSTPLSLAQSVQLRLEAEVDEAADCTYVCMRELEKQELFRHLEENSKIRNLLS
mmetsp:Transcript_18842/g.35334  ORF Transcript_18842/g.35334 Transcript_18842/m.35334 type:complete len:166 (+) Transcript_18842:35-532(+)